MKQSFARKPISVLLSLVMLLSVFGCLAFSAAAAGWEMAAYPSGSTQGPAATLSANGKTLTYYAQTAAYSVNHETEGWWFGVKFTAPSAAAAAAAEFTGGSNPTRKPFSSGLTDVGEGDAVRVDTILVNPDKIYNAFLHNEQYITYTYTFYDNAYAYVAAATFEIRIDLEDILLTKYSEDFQGDVPVLQTVDGSLRTWKVAATQSDDAFGQAALSNDGRTLTYSNMCVNLAELVQAGDETATEAWWLGAMMFYIGEHTADTVAVRRTCDVTDAFNKTWTFSDVKISDFFELWAPLNVDMVKTALAADKKITYTYSFYNNGSVTATPDETFYVVLDLNDFVMYNGDEIIIEIADGAFIRIDPPYEIPTGLQATYGDLLADVALPLNWAWAETADTTVGDAGVNQFRLTYTTPASFEPARYNATVSATTTVNVAKAPGTEEPGYYVPEMNAKYLQTLKDVRLPEGWSWDAALSTPVGEIGNQVFQATYLPADFDNYELVENVDVTIHVGRASGTLESTYFGPHDLKATYGDRLSDVTLGEGDRWVWKYPDTLVGDVGKKNFIATYQPVDTFHFAPADVSLKVTVKKATPTITTLPTTASAISYGQAIGSSRITDGVAKLGNTNVKGSFVFSNAAATPSVAQSGTNYTVRFVPDDWYNFNAVENICEIPVTVVKANPVVTAPVSTEPTHSRIRNQVLIRAGATNGGTLVYALSTDGTEPEASAFSTELPYAKEEGTYTVYYKVIGNENFNDSPVMSIKATIHPTLFKTIMLPFINGLKQILDIVRFALVLH